MMAANNPQLPKSTASKRIAILGTGRVGSALAGGWLKAGHSVALGTRDPHGEKAQALLSRLPAAAVTTIPRAVATADIVVLATPWSGAQAALEAAGDLAGKVLIDCTNSIGPAGLTVGPDTSGAEQVASWAPGARVAKAFNTVGAEVMADTRYAAGRPALLLCADDAGARQAAAELAVDLGFEPVDCGPLRLARSLEHMALLWVTLARGGLGRHFAWSLLRR
jgi:predicted dinucleotide-binding enzyme